MSKSKNDNIRRHILYPQSSDCEIGYLFNEDSFFGYLAPEEAQKLLDAQEKQSFIEIKQRHFPILKGCAPRILQGNMADEHSQCYSFLISYDEHWELSCSCEYLNEVDFLREIQELGGYKLNHEEIQRKIDFAQPSSMYENPFLGFDNPDKKYAPQEWLVEDTFPARSLNAIVGVSDSFKSFLAIHLACCIATGTPFFGKDVQKALFCFLHQRAVKACQNAGRRGRLSMIGRTAMSHSSRARHHSALVLKTTFNFCATNSMSLQSLRQKRYFLIHWDKALAAMMKIRPKTSTE